MKDNRVRTLIKARLDQANETLEDADYLIQGGKSGHSVVNRAYYAAFYALLGLLQTIGKAPKKHGEAISLFDREFVKPRLLGKEYSEALHWLFDQRMTDDYTNLDPISHEETRCAMEYARVFVTGAREFLQEKNYLDS